MGIIKNGKPLVFDKMDIIRSKLGKREYQVVLQARKKLDAYEYVNGSYMFRAGDVDAIARMLETISASDWTLMDISMRESALEEIYVKLMMDG